MFLSRARSRRREFPRDLTSVRAARDFTSATLAEWGLADRDDDARLCVSELATNALLHGDPTGREFSVRLEADTDWLRIAVRDTGAGRPAPRAFGPDGDGGRGLALIAELADAYGFTEHTVGKTVWLAFKVGAPRGAAGVCEAEPVSEPMGEPAWERRLSDAWASAERSGAEEFVATVEKLVAELPPGSAIGLFERAAALDATGRGGLAAPLFRQALDLGLTGERRRRAVIALAGTLRDAGRAAESVELLTEELAAGSDELDDVVRAFLALALLEADRGREAVSVALGALAPHLPLYQRSLGNYARLLSPGS
ncbi:tetratricopeptide repeat protein [Streptomyces specialis]|uniref:tetratricopeptide repeat protein n=1 Tax=Streptomyces specialis TaxID=498367 RepID=UPI000A503032|nr:tetratricopeptide repeat protein [Streptomyces specialis]